MAMFHLRFDYGMASQLLSRPRQRAASPPPTLSDSTESQFPSHERGAFSTPSSLYPSDDERSELSDLLILSDHTPSIDSLLFDDSDDQSDFVLSISSRDSAIPLHSPSLVAPRATSIQQSSPSLTSEPTTSTQDPALFGPVAVEGSSKPGDGVMRAQRELSERRAVEQEVFLGSLFGRMPGVDNETLRLIASHSSTPGPPSTPLERSTPRRRPQRYHAGSRHVAKSAHHGFSALTHHARVEMGSENVFLRMRGLARRNSWQSEDGEETETEELGESRTLDRVVELGEREQGSALLRTVSLPPPLDPPEEEPPRRKSFKSLSLSTLPYYLLGALNPLAHSSGGASSFGSPALSPPPASPEVEPVF